MSILSGITLFGDNVPTSGAKIVAYYADVTGTNYFSTVSGTGGVWELEVPDGQYYDIIYSYVDVSETSGGSTSGNAYADSPTVDLGTAGIPSNPLDISNVIINNKAGGSLDSWSATLSSQENDYSITKSSTTNNSVQFKTIPGIKYQINASGILGSGRGINVTSFEPKGNYTFGVSIETPSIQELPNGKEVNITNDELSQFLVWSGASSKNRVNLNILISYILEDSDYINMATYDIEEKIYSRF
jgi:hypothetical protein